MNLGRLDFTWQAIFARSNLRALTVLRPVKRSQVHILWRHAPVVMYAVDLSVVTSTEHRDAHCSCVHQLGQGERGRGRERGGGGEREWKRGRERERRGERDSERGRGEWERGREGREREREGRARERGEREREKEREGGERQREREGRAREGGGEREAEEEIKRAFFVAMILSNQGKIT